MERAYIEYDYDRNYIRIQSKTKDIEISLWEGQVDADSDTTTFCKYEISNLETNDFSSFIINSSDKDFNIKNEEIGLNVDFTDVSEIYTELLKNEELRVRGMPIEEKKKEIIFNNLRSVYFGGNQGELEVRNMLFNNDEKFFGYDSNGECIKNNIDEFVDFIINKEIDNSKDDNYFILNLIGKFGLLDKLIENKDMAFIQKDILNMNVNDLIKIEGLNLAIFNEDNGVIATDGNMFIRLPDAELKRYDVSLSDEKYFLSSEDFKNFKTLTNNDEFSVNGVKYKADYDNLKCMEIINYDNSDFISIGNINKDNNKIEQEEKPEVKAVNKIKNNI